MNYGTIDIKIKGPFDDLCGTFLSALLVLGSLICVQTTMCVLQDERDTWVRLVSQ